MDKEAFAKVGLELAEELRTLVTQYHVKSDNCDILLYEAATIEQETNDLISETGVQENLKESTLLSECGCTLAGLIPEVSNRVRNFHEEYRKNST